MRNKWYWTFKHILMGPFVRLWNRPTIEGADRVPAEGPGLIVSSHQAVMDSLFFPLVMPRQLRFPAKKEYFEGVGFAGKLQKFFFSSVGQVPLDRDAAGAANAMCAAAEQVFSEGDLFGIYPEGTRSPDGRIYRGHTGMARVALHNPEVPVIPVAMIGTRRANPIGSWLLRPVKVHMVVGEPIDVAAWIEEHDADPDSREAARAFTDEVMAELSRLSGYDYVDVYASEVKDSLARGDGYPEGAEPGRQAG